jgi:hypothetical protein
MHTFFILHASRTEYITIGFIHIEISVTVTKFSELVIECTKKVQYNRNSYCMIQSANQKQEMKSVSHPFQICSKYFGSSNFGTGNKCCPANENMVCTNIILFLF